MRTDPRGEAPQDPMEREITLARREQMRDLLESAGWREVLLPRIKGQLQQIAHGLATGTGKEIEEIRAAQGAYRALAAFCNLEVEDAVKWRRAETDEKP